MAIFRVRNDVAELEALRGSLGNSLLLKIQIETETTRDYEDLFVELLTSPECGVSVIWLSTTCGNISPVVKLLLHPDNAIRTLEYDCRARLSVEHAQSLTSILKRPGNKLRSLVLEGLTLDSRAAFEPIASALQHPHNTLERLSLELPFDVDMATDMASAIRSEHFKVTALSLRSTRRLRECTLEAILEALITKPLKSLHLSVDCDGRSTYPAHAVLADMIRLPGSTLEVLRLDGDLLPEEITSVLGALQFNHNKLHTFDYKQTARTSSKAFLESFFNGITKALSCPNNRLVHLALDFGGVDTMVPCLAESLKSEFCNLRTLRFNYFDPRPLEVEHVAALCEALEDPNCCLEQLTVLVNEASLGHLERLLTSPKYPLKRLEMRWDTDNREIMRRFLTAVRTSRLEVCHLPQLLPFSRAFESRWYRVFCTLLSVHDIPRLCSNQRALPRLPMKNLILNVVETLGWPLHYLIEPYS